MPDIRIFLLNADAFVDLGTGYLLCIGTKAELDAASDQRIMEMIGEAIAHANFKSISKSPKVVC